MQMQKIFRQMNSSRHMETGRLEGREHKKPKGKLKNMHPVVCDVKKCTICSCKILLNQAIITEETANIQLIKLIYKNTNDIDTGLLSCNAIWTWR
jgi:hypothetical protein